MWIISCPLQKKKNSNCFHQIIILCAQNTNPKNQVHLALHLLVVLTLFVESKMELALVHAFLDILVILTKIVDQNALSTVTVHSIKPAFRISVKILALVLVVPMQNATLPLMFLLVYVYLHIRAIHLNTAHFCHLQNQVKYLKNVNYVPTSSFLKNIIFIYYALFFSDIPPTPVNPCYPSPCGPNSQCKELNGQAICSCSPTFFGTPPSCRPECVTNAECPTHLSCIKQKCQDPCPGTCGHNADCRVLSHSPICSCRPQHTGNPFVSCSPIPGNISAFGGWKNCFVFQRSYKIKLRFISHF